MAGFFPDVPAYRFPLDRDGSRLLLRNITAGTPWTDESAQLIVLQDESANNWNFGSGVQNNVYEFSIVFPEPRDVAGYHVGVYAPSSGGGSPSQFNPQEMYASTDTTDGMDGTWTQILNPFVDTDTNVVSTHQIRNRDSINNLSQTGLRGIRLRYLRTNGSNSPSFLIYVFHFYGSIPAGANDERIEFWDPSSDQQMPHAHFDFGDMPRGSQSQKQFRIKNLSATQTANGIDLTIEDLESSGLTSGLELSTDGSNWLSSINIGNLAPGAISSSLYIRRTVGGAESLRPRVGRINAAAGSWS